MGRQVGSAATSSMRFDHVPEPLIVCSHTMLPMPGWLRSRLRLRISAPLLLLSGLVNRNVVFLQPVRVSVSLTLGRSGNMIARSHHLFARPLPGLLACALLVPPLPPWSALARSPAHRPSRAHAAATVAPAVGPAGTYLRWAKIGAVCVVYYSSWCEPAIQLNQARADRPGGSAVEECNDGARGRPARIGGEAHRFR